MLKIKQFVCNPFDENTYLVIDETTHDAAVIDPGMFNDRERKAFDDFVEANNIHITQIINTHAHLDHCFGDNYVRDKYDVKVAASIGDAPLAASLGLQARRFGIVGGMDPVVIDTPLADGDIIRIGDSTMQVLAVPGHSKGGLALYSAEGRFVLSGDSLFQGSIGRTDLEGGSMPQLVSAVRQKLLSLPDDTVVLPGHGPHTTVGAEKRSNPFLQ